MIGELYIARRSRLTGVLFFRCAFGRRIEMRIRAPVAVHDVDHNVTYKQQMCCMILICNVCMYVFVRVFLSLCMRVATDMTAMYVYIIKYMVLYCMKPITLIRAHSRHKA